MFQKYISYYLKDNLTTVHSVYSWYLKQSGAKMRIFIKNHKYNEKFMESIYEAVGIIIQPDYDFLQKTFMINIVKLKAFILLKAFFKLPSCTKLLLVFLELIN